MNVISLFMGARDVFNKGKALKNSGMLTNIEACSAALYSLLSAIILLAKDAGFDIFIKNLDLHTMANGWAATASIAYAIYRLVTNPAAGFSKGV
jgi:hypothetical protein